MTTGGMTFVSKVVKESQCPGLNADNIAEIIAQQLKLGFITQSVMVGPAGVRPG